MLREKLLQKRPRRRKDFVIPEDFGDLAGERFAVVAMTARERATFETQFAKGGKPLPDRQREVRERLVIETVVNPDDGSPMFTLADLSALGDVDGALIEYMVQASQELNQMTDGDLEEVAKNSDATPADSTP